MGKGKINKKSIGHISRKKGHDAERYYAKKFREFGFDKVQTSRYGSRLHDDAGIDLINLPLNIQIKAGKQTGMKSWEVIQYTKNKVKEILPENYPEQNYPTILIYKRDVGKGKQRIDTHEIVSMSFKDFLYILKKEYGSNSNI